MRYPDLPADASDVQQRLTAEALGGTDGVSLPGPYAALIYAPAVAELVFRLDQHLRFGLRIPERLRVLVVLCTAGRLRAEDVQPFLALESTGTCGLEAAVLDALAAGKAPVGLAEDEAAVYEFTQQLVDKGRVTQASFERTSAVVGKEVCLEIVKICGFTLYISNVMNITGRKYAPAAN